MAAKGVERAGHAGSVLLLCNFLQSCGRPQSKPTKMKICKSLIGLSLCSTTHNGQLKFAMSAVAPRQTTSTFVIHVAVISSSFPSREKKVTFDMPFPTGCFTLLKYKNNEPVFIKLCQGI